MIAGSEGEYKFNCPLNRRFVDFTDIDADQFRVRVEQGKSDDDIVAWVKSKTTALNETEIAAWCRPMPRGCWPVPRAPAAGVHPDFTRPVLAKLSQSRPPVVTLAAHHGTRAWRNPLVGVP